MTKRGYPDDTFTEQDVERCLDQAGLHYHDKGRYYLSQCPTHEDTHSSCQIYKDDWFVNCHASCGRYHITKAYPELRGQSANASSSTVRSRNKVSQNRMSEVKYIEQDQMDYWKTLPLIPRDHIFKNLPLNTLDLLGWRWVEEKNSYFIPYFNRSQTRIPFSQLRHLQGERRFTFLKDARPTMYGTWNLLEGMGKIFLVEGTSDFAVLETCAVPCVAAPSSSSGVLVGKLCQWASENGIQVVYAGDNDEAGDKLRAAVEESGVAYRVKQPRYPYKDWGEMYEAEGYDSVRDYAMKEIDPTWDDTLKKFKEGMTEEEKILELFPGATVLKIK